jgi:hypothetical protein
MRVVAAILLAVVCLFAQQTFTVGELVKFVSSSIQLKHPDKEVAALLAKSKVSEHLEDRVIEDLQGQGAGPKTVAALRALGEASVSLPLPGPKAPKAAPVVIPPPPPEEQAAIIDEIRDYAMTYTNKLPDFICTQVTRRYYDPTGMEFWRSLDTITARVSYFEQHEDYKLVLVNNQYTTMKMEALGGATSTGEFGSLLKSTLQRKAKAQIEWDHWATLRGKRTYVFSYHVSSYNSEWRIVWERSQEIITGYQGLIYVERDTHQVLRITLEAENIPTSFPVQEARTTLDYDYAKIGESEFLLPLRFVTRMRHEKDLNKNESEFRMYRKFSAEATVTFDTPDPLPEDQTKEQPLKEQPHK